MKILRKTSKIRKIISIAIISILVISGSLLLLLYTIGDRILNEVMDREIARLEKNMDIDTDIPGEDTSTGPSEAADPDTATATATATDSESNTDPEKQSGENQAEDNQAEDNQAEDNQAEGTDKAAADKSSEAEKQDANKPDAAQEAKKEAAITPDKIKDIKDDVTAADKVTAAALVFKRLNTSDIGVLQGMLTGGLSSEEKAKAKNIAYARFTADEIKKIKEIYSKYMK